MSLSLYLAIQTYSNPTFRCQICGHVFDGKEANQKDISKHYTVHKEEDPENYVVPNYVNQNLYECSLCDEEFLHRSHWENHMKNDHRIPKPYLCDECNSTFLKYERLHHHKMRVGF